MRKTMWKGIISGIAAGAFLLSSVPVIAEEVVPLSEDIVEYDDEQYSVDVIEEDAVEEDLEVVDSVEKDPGVNDLIEDPEEAPDEDTVLMASEENIAINEENFEDAAFRECVTAYDNDKDGYLSPEEISAVVFMPLAIRGIGSLKGIEYFSSLRELDCRENQLTSLDVSQNQALETLYCESNEITNLNLGQNQALVELYCGYNNITNLDLSQTSFLGELSCMSNPIQELDLSKNTNLGYLNCDSCQLTSLNVSQNPNLSYLSFSYNMITSVDLSHNTNLGRLHCEGNKLSSLDVSNNTALAGLFCNNNQLTSLGLGNNPELYDLFCQANQLTALDISNCPKIKETYINGEHLSQSGVEKYTTYEVDEEDHYTEDSRLYFDTGISIKTGAEHAHSFGAWTVTVPATEDAEGQQVRTCSGCGQTETAIVPRVVVNISISKKPSLSKPKAGAKGKVTITWKKFKQTKKTKAIWKKIKKVEVQYSTDSTFRTNVTKKLVGKGKTKLIVKGLAKKTTYYVRVRYFDGTGYSAWSKVKKVKTKK